MAGPRFSSFLSRSLDVLERERPDVATRLAAVLAALAVAASVDGETVRLASDGEVVRVTPRTAGEAAVAVTVATSRATILALVDGRVSLIDAVLSDALLLRGSPGDLARFHDALWLYLQGAVRVPAFAELLASYRTA